MLIASYQFKPWFQLLQVYQDYVNTYRQKTSLYNLFQAYEDETTTRLCVYDTESETGDSRLIDTPVTLGCHTTIVQLPNGKLFCYGNIDSVSGVTLLLNLNGDAIEFLSAGFPCSYSSGIYINNNIYCFGGNTEGWELTTHSARFDLDENRWNQLSPIPQPDYQCSSVIFNGDILVSGNNCRNLWIYSINIDSFSTIPYEFAEKKRKLLFNTEERLYLIEFSGSIYESEIGSCTIWRRISDSLINDPKPWQAYWSYNKDAIYLGVISSGWILNCFKFNLSEKRLIAL